MARPALADAARPVKRFYAHARAEDGAILLDGRPVRTPARAPLRLSSPGLAEAIADEWNGQGETIDPRSMPLTGLANAAIDRIGGDREGFATGLARYAESELLCYRASEPAALVLREAERWDPLLDWARRRYDIAFVVTAGIVHQPQPAATLARLAAALGARDPFQLAGLTPLVEIGGSLVTALAVAEGAITPEDGFDAASVDEDWQAERWGRDLLAAETRKRRRDDFLTAARFLTLL